MGDNKKVDCKYGKGCYQKNPAHHEKYNHPQKDHSDASEAVAKDDKPLQKKRSPSPFLDADSKRQKKSPGRKSPTPTRQQAEKKAEGSKSPSPSKKRPSKSRSPSKRSKSRSLSPSAKRRSTSLSPNRGKKSKEDTMLLKVDEDPKLIKKARSASPKSLNERRSKSPLVKKESPPQTTKEESSKTADIASCGTSSSSSNQDKLREIAERKEMDITKEYKEVMKNLSKSNYYEIYQRRVRYSKKAEYQDLLKTTEFIRHKFLVEMPPDFYKFWDFCESITKDGDKPEKCLESFGLKLVGPFDYLAGKFHDANIREPGDYLRHWRFYYDPPEFQTIFVMSGTEVHYGYWRDDPKEKENLLIARNDSKKGFEFEFIAGNAFEAVIYFLEKDVVFTPFNRGKINDLKKKIQNYAQENGIALNSLESLKKARNARVVCKTFHKAGLVVPTDKKTQVGYRNLMTSDANLKSILTKIGHAQGARKTIQDAIEELQPIVTAANIAVDECDFGTSVELGIDLFCSGNPEVHEIASQLLITGYTMLKRPQFIAIMKAHMENRKRGNNLDIQAN